MEKDHKMKILFSRLPIERETPWGGGNVHLYHIHKYLIKMGHKVIQYQHILEPGLGAPNIDLCYVTDPRRADHIYDLAEKHNIPIVQRVGDLGTHGKPEIIDLLKRRQGLVNTFIFPSIWAQRYAMKAGLEVNHGVVIPNVADPIFRGRPLKIVTHHWSDNPMKGEEIYSQLIEDCEDLNVKFTYIGRPCFKISDENLSSNFNYLPPQSKKELHEELQKHDFYLTASKLEAGANHVLEAIECGLPVYYHVEGGSIPEYCIGRGIRYSSYKELKRFLKPKHDIESACEQYYDLFNRVALFEEFSDN